MFVNTLCEYLSIVYVYATNILLISCNTTKEISWYNEYNYYEKYYKDLELEILLL